MASVTPSNESKNSKSVTNVDKRGRNITIDEAAGTIDNAEGTIDLPRTSVVEESKNNINVSNESK